MNRYDNNFLQIKILMDEYDKLRKQLTKTFSRLFEKKIKDKNIKGITNKDGTESNIMSINRSFNRSIHNKTIKENTMSIKLTSTLHTLMFNIKNGRFKKNITICINENIIAKIKWEQFKYVIIKYLNKYFSTNENDKFGFVQFGVNGLITKSFLSQSLNNFIFTFNKVKNNIEINNYSLLNNSEGFIGLYDIFDSIIKNYQKTEENDNIIMLFIDEKYIRFSSINDCLSIVEALNGNNVNFFFFCFNEIIINNKVNNIQSFLNGLIEGHLFQIKNYEQLKEIFVNLSTKDHQINFFKYDYDCFEHNL